MNTKAITQQIAAEIGVDEIAVETLANMCVDRIKDWDIGVDEDIVAAAVMDARIAFRRATITALTRPEFTGTIIGMVKVGDNSEVES